VLPLHKCLTTDNTECDEVGDVQLFAPFRCSVDCGVKSSLAHVDLHTKPLNDGGTCDAADWMEICA
jgi:hypothetical protein